MTPAEAAHTVRLSSGETLEQAAGDRLLVLVFLRHFGCTFTRQILKGLEILQQETKAHGARLILVHMLKKGDETQYLGAHSDVERIADPQCDLYRAFGLGHGTFIELFGPHVWWRSALSMARGCGAGHLAGDGLQMPGAFLFHEGKIIASQKARSAADLPDLRALFKALPSSSGHEKFPI